jgi:hypothetical protein
VASIVSNQVDLRSQTVTVSFANTTYTNNIGTLFFNLVGGGAVVLNGNSATAASTTTGVSAIGIDCRPANGSNGACAQIENFTITCAASSAFGIFVGGGSITTGTGMTFGSCTGGYHRTVDGQGAVLTSQSAYSITGGAVAHGLAINGLIGDNNTVAVTLTGTPAFSGAFALAELGAQIFSTNTFSGAATGVRYEAITGGIISSNGGGPNYFPGSTAGYTTSGGTYDSPGTPSVSACGTTPGSPVGTDTAGHVTEGTTATGCTITFTTSNTPSSCTFNLSTGNAVGISAFGSSAVTVTHASLSNNVLYWTCPPQVH